MKKSISFIAAVLCSVLLFNCSKKENTEKQIKVEMKMLNDSTAEATVTVAESSGGTKNETVKVIQGKPEKVKAQIDSLK
jgi:outer membrane lipoprotein-sorting protein